MNPYTLVSTIWFAMQISIAHTARKVVLACSAKRDFQWLIQRTLRSGPTFTLLEMATPDTAITVQPITPAPHIPSGGTACIAYLHPEFRQSVTWQGCHERLASHRGGVQRNACQAVLFLIFRI